VPERTCVGCRAKRPQSELVRVVRGADDGTLVVGRTLPGRGAWLCAGSVACLGLAERRGALARALRTQLPAGATQALRAAIEGCARMEGRSESEIEGM